jgi:5-methylthioadenosine/S-adenosylhomocysteine deaminase
LSEQRQQHVDLLISARWVIPVQPHGQVLEDHAVVVRDGCIVAMLPAAEAAAQYVAKETVHLGEHALIPGLVNAHVHNPMTLMRGLADDLPLMEWLQEHIWPAEARVMGPEYVADGAELAIAEMLRGGTTCCNENYFFPDVLAATYRRFGFRAMVGLPVIEFPSAWASSVDQYFDKGLAVHDDYKGDPLIGTCFAPHAPYTVGDASFRRIKLLSDQLDIKVHLHLLETAHDLDHSQDNHNTHPLARLDGFGLLDARLIAVHMTQLGEAEIAQCARAGVSVVHCPESNLKLASGFCPADALIRAGVNVSLGTDGCASNNDLDMFGEMRTAALLGKGVARNASALDAATTLRMATLNGARALGWEERIGSIEPGKEADLAAIRLDALETQPMFNPLSHLVYAASRRQVSDVWVRGVHKLRDSALVGMDLEGMVVRAGRWRARMIEVAA